MKKTTLTLVILAVGVAAGVGLGAGHEQQPRRPPQGPGTPPPARPAAAGDEEKARRPAAAPAGERDTICLDEGWRFAFGHAADMDRDFGFGGGMSYSKITSWGGPVQPPFDDAGWRQVNLPHDWVVDLPFVREPRTDELVSHGYKPVGRAFPETSVGWYRKRFTVPKEDEGKRFFIDFDGAFRDCHVWLNGVLLGRHEGGYAPFGYDATDLVLTGGENVLVVRVDATHAEGWFYEGAGIYRHVWLVKTAPIHLPKWGIVVTSSLDGPRADVTVRTDVANDSDRAETAVLESRVLDPAGKTVATLTEPAVAVRPWQMIEVRQVTQLPDPVRWSLERPALYQLVSTLRLGSRVVDLAATRFGIRSIRFDPDRGFFLNGQRVQINGVCNHQDHAGVGAAVPDRLQRFRLERLKEMGVNAYRTSHNPPAQEILDGCDELGILVMDETRLFSSGDLALEHLRTLVRRDRNHPSVILWSIGNEEPEQATARGNRVARSMIRAVKALDVTRPVTYASNSGAFTGVNEAVDVRGFNYVMSEIDRYHKEHPLQPLIGSEIASTLCTRGEYAVDESRGYMSAYDKAKPRWGELAEEWMAFYTARPWLAGAFVWTGFDYRGEPTPYEWPCISSHFGILDTCGFPKDLFWYYKSWWTSEPVLHLLPHWNWRGRGGHPIEVWAFSNADQVQLSLNGRDLGTRRIERYGHAEWQVPYEAGALRAVGYRNGREIARTTVETTGEPSHVELEADRSSINADGRDVAVVRVAAVDDQGRMVPVAGHDVFFDLAGPGRILGVGSGDPSSHEADAFAATTPAHRRLFNGLAQVLVQSTREPGDITLRGRAEGLAPFTLTIRTAPRGRAH